MWLGFGLANLAGTVLARHLLTCNLASSLVFMPLLMGLVIAGLMLLGRQPVVALGQVAFWGMAAGHGPSATLVAAATRLSENGASVVRL